MCAISRAVTYSIRLIAGIMAIVYSPRKKSQIHNKPSEPSIAIDKGVDKDKLLMNLRCEFYNAKLCNLVLRLATQHHIFPTTPEVRIKLLGSKME